MGAHDIEYSIFKAFDRFAGQGCHGVEEVHVEGAGSEEEALAGRHDLFCVEDDGGKDGMAGGEGEPEGAVVKGFEGFGGLVAGTFGVDAHMKAQFEHFLHFCEAVPAAGLTFTVDEDASGAIKETEDGDPGHFDLGDGLVTAGDKGVGDGDVDQGIMVADDDIRLAGCEFFAAPDAQGAAGERQENAHPYAREFDPGSCLLGFGSKIAEQEEGDQDDEHRRDKNNDHPYGPDAAEYGPEEIGSARRARSGGAVRRGGCAIIHAAI